MKRYTFLTALLLSFGLTGIGSAEEVTITTFHPSPVGDYRDLTSVNFNTTNITASTSSVGTANATRLTVSNNITAADLLVTNTADLGNNAIVTDLKIDGSVQIAEVAGPAVGAGCGAPGSIQYSSGHFFGCVNGTWRYLDAYN